MVRVPAWRKHTCNVTVAGGDEIFADTQLYSGSEYETYIIDWTTSEGCYGYSFSSFMGAAHWAQFMGESGGSLPPLPKFSQLSVWTGYYHNNSGTNYLISNNWAYGYVINVTTTAYSCDGINEYFNVCPSGVDGSTGDFTETWETSSGF